MISLRLNFNILKSNLSIQKQSDLFNFISIKNQRISYGALDSGALHWNSSSAERHAEQYYNFCRKRKTDCDVIAQNTGFRKKDIQRIKNHIFFDNHRLWDEEIGRFDPSYDMAQSWQRLSENKGLRIEDNDITMLNHEFLESIIEKSNNLSYREAHNKADKVYHYLSEREKEAMNYDGMVHRINRNRR